MDDGVAVAVSFLQVAGEVGNFQTPYASVSRLQDRVPRALNVGHIWDITMVRTNVVNHEGYRRP